MDNLYPKGGVGIFVINSKMDKILIGKRKDTNTYAKPGGWFEYGETFEECGSREVREETELEVSPERMVHIKTYNCYDPINHYHNVAIYLYCILEEQEEDKIVNVEPHKNEFWKWIGFDFILENMDNIFFPFRVFLEKYNIKRIEDLFIKSVLI